MRRLVALACLLVATAALAETWPKKGDVVYMPVLMDTIAVGAVDWLPQRRIIPACTPLTVTRVKNSGEVRVVTASGTKYQFCDAAVASFMYRGEDECRQVATTSPAYAALDGNGCHVLSAKVEK